MLQFSFMIYKPSIFGSSENSALPKLYRSAYNSTLPPFLVLLDQYSSLMVPVSYALQHCWYPTQFRVANISATYLSFAALELRALRRPFSSFFAPAQMHSSRKSHLKSWTLNQPQAGYDLWGLSSEMNLMQRGSSWMTPTPRAWHNSFFNASWKWKRSRKLRAREGIPIKLWSWGDVEERCETSFSLSSIWF